MEDSQFTSSVDGIKDELPAVSNGLSLDPHQKVQAYHQQTKQYLDRIDRSLAIINSSFQETIDSIEESIDALKKMFPEEFVESQDEPF